MVQHNSLFRHYLRPLVYCHWQLSVRLSICCKGNDHCVPRTPTWLLWAVFLQSCKQLHIMRHLCWPFLTVSNCFQPSDLKVGMTRSPCHWCNPYHAALRTVYLIKWSLVEPSAWPTVFCLGKSQLRGSGYWWAFIPSSWEKFAKHLDTFHDRKEELLQTILDVDVGIVQVTKCLQTLRAGVFAHTDSV